MQLGKNVIFIFSGGGGGGGGGGEGRGGEKMELLARK